MYVHSQKEFSVEKGCGGTPHQGPRLLVTDTQTHRRWEGTAQKQEGSPGQGCPALLFLALKTNEAANADPSSGSSPFVQPLPTFHKLSPTGSYERQPPLPRSCPHLTQCLFRRPGCWILIRASP